MIRIKNAAAKIAGAMIAMGLTAGAAFAEIDTTMNVTLPESVNVGGTMLPSGAYHVEEFRNASGERTLVFRDANSKPMAVVTGAETASSKDVGPGGFNNKNEFVLTTGEDGVTHLRSLFLEGDNSGLHFPSHR